MYLQPGMFSDEAAGSPAQYSLTVTPLVHARHHAVRALQQPPGVSCGEGGGAEEGQSDGIVVGIRLVGIEDEFTLHRPVPKKALSPMVFFRKRSAGSVRPPLKPWQP